MTFLTPRNAQRPADDPIFALNREATQRAATGERIINATVGALLEDDGTLAVLPSVVDAIREVPAVRAAGYAPIAGTPEFLAAVIDDAVGGTSLATQAVAVATPGGTGALRHALSLFLERGQSMLTTSFYWGPYATLCDEHERGLRTFEMFAPDGSFHLAAMERALDTMATEQGRILLFLNDPCHNPTGYSLNDHEGSAVAAVLSRIAERVPLVVLADVAYRAYAKNPRGLLAHLAPLASKALVLFAWSGSKAFAEYGARIGALVACTDDAAQRTAIQRAMSFASRGSWSNCNAAGQIAVARCLSEGALRAKVDAERSRLIGLLDARVAVFNTAAHATTLRYPRYDGGFFVTVFVDDAPKAAEALKAHGVFVVPQKGALRVALCSVAERDVGDLVAAIDTVVRGTTTAPPANVKEPS